MKHCCSSDVILVSEQSIIEAMRLIKKELKVLVEPSGAVPLAAILQDSRFRGKRAACVLSGGNIRPDTFDHLVSSGPSLSKPISKL